MNPEPANPFYRLLLAVGVVFVLTVLAIALVPLENQPEWLQAHFAYIVLVEVALLIVLGLLSMGLDRIRTLRNPPASATIPPQNVPPPPPEEPK